MKTIDIFKFIFFTSTLFSCTSNYHTQNEPLLSNQMEFINDNSATDNNESLLALTSFKECHCNAISYVTKCPKDGIQLFDDQNNVVESIFFDADNEDFLTVEISAFKVAKAKINWIQKTDDLDPDKQFANHWIATSHLQIFLPDSKTKVSFYQEPNNNSEINNYITPYEIVHVQLLNCCENWIFGIFTTKNGDKLEGWLHPDDFCSNPLSNC